MSQARKLMAFVAGGADAESFHAPAWTVEATVDGRPLTWANQLVNSSGDYLPHVLPAEPTLHWANPPGGTGGRDKVSKFTKTPGPYTGRCRWWYTCTARTLTRTPMATPRRGNCRLPRTPPRATRPSAASTTSTRRRRSPARAWSGRQSEVVNREPISGGPVTGPSPWELGRKDPCSSPIGYITRVKATFDHKGLFVWHCHLFDHEDNAMMRPYQVT